MMTKAEMLLGGPGLVAYTYQADVLCVVCAQDIIAEGPDELEDDDARDSEVTPQPVFFGESDTAQHCGNCGEYLYGARPGCEMEDRSPREDWLDGA